MIDWPDLYFDPVNLLNCPKQSEFRLITHVAIIYNGKVYSLPEPNRHHHVTGLIGGIKGLSTQGSLDQNGRFLNRREAYDLAISTGQLNRKANWGYVGDSLFSEDLW
jgi:hypothetical protein